ncbi:hypothetical protein Poly59_27330 [Rubripirellula reticaptiva]|uniref:Uncharacterized protein n=1 Tax=Rubripirellula reticaptiva TaxID=2528013 RepID=A0A5C6EN31_9BACT|nr:hypothetical protein Poly59_27330 [Rubripirellula reticaptiva]
MIRRTGPASTEDQERSIYGWIIGYVLAALLTNAYCQVHRWGDWTREPNTREDAMLNTAFATAAWPIYWSSRLAIKVVHDLSSQAPVDEVYLPLSTLKQNSM